MSKNLVIVESPAKAKTIERYLGNDYQVKSSFGHIRDLPKKGLNIDISKDFKPHYEIPADKKKTISELKKASASADNVWLASDEDREGEAIAWHLAQALKLDDKKTKRIVFHEITKQAIENAIKNPRGVNMQLVNAQQARRVLDRLVGYELSPVLWKKVRPGLSAGRVQSVAVRLIVEREREIKDFEAASSYKVTALLKAGSDDLAASLDDKLSDENTVRKFLNDCIGAEFTVKDIQTKPGNRSPGAPFITSTLQQEASSRLGYSVKQTMTLAQRLYESGHITYMRTDSTTLSGFAIKAAENYITKNYGAKYYQIRQYKTKSQSAQEAHEAIRPTDFNKSEAGDDQQQQKLYQLIWRRALASQMASALVDKTQYLINIDKRPETFIAKGEVLKFDGYLKVYGGTKDDVILPAVKIGQKLGLDSMTALQIYTRPPARYSEATLVKKLEELGIGRPSTYAPTISTIQTRGYVEKKDLPGQVRQLKKFVMAGEKLDEQTEEETTGADKNKLVPTAMATITTDFLVKHFSSVVDYNFTAHVEKGFDEIAAGKQEWNKMIKTFYDAFSPLVKKSENVSREETSQTRELGTDPKSGKPILARYGRYGPMLQRGLTESEDKPDFAPLPDGAELENVTFEQALEMFKLPRLIGKTDDGKPIQSNIGRFGPYIQIGDIYVSIKPHDPMKITEDEAKALYSEKLMKDAEKNINSFASGIKILNGPYGPYITDGKKNARIDKSIKPEDITEGQAKDLLAKAPAKKRFVRRKIRK